MDEQDYRRDTDMVLIGTRLLGEDYPGTLSSLDVDVCMTQAILDIVQDRQHAKDFQFRERLLCPICLDRPDMYAEGFLWPEGLRRHLDGWGNQRQCPVMAAAARLRRAL
jgi:hypothetical protein